MEVAQRARAQGRTPGAAAGDVEDQPAAGPPGCSQSSVPVWDLNCRETVLVNMEVVGLTRAR